MEALLVELERLYGDRRRGTAGVLSTARPRGPDRADRPRPTGESGRAPARPDDTAGARRRTPRRLRRRRPRGAQ